MGWDIFHFSETAERNSKKLDRKQDLNVFYQVCVIGADSKNKIAALASDWQTFSTSSLKSLNGIQRYLTGSKLLTSSTKFVFLGRSERWPPWPLIDWEFFDFSDETAERNSKKLDRKQDLKVLYLACVFRADRKNKMATQASNWMRHFRLLLWNRWTQFNKTWQERRSQCPLPSLCFSGRSENKMAALASDWLRHFRLFHWKRWTEFNETWQEARSQRRLPGLWFLGWSEKQDGRPSL